MRRGKVGVGQERGRKKACHLDLGNLDAHTRTGNDDDDGEQRMRVDPRRLPAVEKCFRALLRHLSALGWGLSQQRELKVQLRAGLLWHVGVVHMLNPHTHIPMHMYAFRISLMTCSPRWRSPYGVWGAARWFGFAWLVLPPTVDFDTTECRKPLNSSIHSEARLSRQDLIALFLALAHALPSLPGLPSLPQR